MMSFAVLCSLLVSFSSVLRAQDPRPRARDVCSMTAVVGQCRARHPRYFFNSETGECELFYYGGCGGNDNNFPTVEACESRCQEEVGIGGTSSVAGKNSASSVSSDSSWASSQSSDSSSSSDEILTTEVDSLFLNFATFHSSAADSLMFSLGVDSEELATTDLGETEDPVEIVEMLGTLLDNDWVFQFFDEPSITTVDFGDGTTVQIMPTDTGFRALAEVMVDGVMEQAWLELDTTSWRITIIFDENIFSTTMDIGTRRRLVRKSETTGETQAQPVEVGRSLLQDTGCNGACATVESCEEPVTDAMVTLHATNNVLGDAIRLFLSGDANGKYCGHICLNPVDTDPIEEACDAINDVMGKICALMSPVTPPLIHYACVSLSLAIAATPAFELAPAALGVCEAVLFAGYYGCKVFGGPVPGGPSYFDTLVCGPTSFVEDVLDELLADEYTLHIEASTPQGGGQTSSVQMTYDGSILDFGTIQLGDEITPTIEYVYAVPSDPAPSENYVVYSGLSCISSTGQIKLTIVGTDGYVGSVTCALGVATCTLYVPGAEELVVDTVALELIGGSLTSTLYLIF